jgi:hypothetical protein
MKLTGQPTKLLLGSKTVRTCDRIPVLDLLQQTRYSYFDKLIKIACRDGTETLPVRAGDCARPLPLRRRGD